MDDDDAVGLPSGDRRPEGVHGQFSGHSVGDGVVDKPVGEQVLDRPSVDLPVFDGRMLGDIRDPFANRVIGCEVSADVVVMNGEFGSLCLASLTHRGRP